MSTVLRKITERRSARRDARRRCARMLDMLRELDEMARDGLLVPAGMESLSFEQLMDGGWARLSVTGARSRRADHP